jgi:uncharacterized protein YjiS (DUF1127 family)
MYYKIKNFINNYLIARENEISLRNMSDYQLKDMGICYSDIDRILAGQPVERKCS